MTEPPIAVVVVLYRTAATASTALRTLAAATGPDDDLRLLVQDNSEDAEPAADAPLPVTERRAAPDNPGLADAYGWAAARAKGLGAEWLVLLDQDTAVTSDYLTAVRAATTPPTGVAADVGVVVPRLVDTGRALSPHGRVRLRAAPVVVSPDGTAEGWVTHLSSGSVLRVAALDAVGGFPRDFPLDQLDHALAASLRAGGWRTAVLPVTLEHRLSVLDRAGLGRDRLHSVLDAEHRYHGTFGSRADLSWLAVRLWAGAALSTAHLRPSPDPALERSAAARATRAALARRRGAHGG